MIKPVSSFTVVLSVPGSPLACPVVLLTLQGQTFNFRIFQEYTQLPDLTLFCKRYKGEDERVLEYMVTNYISISDFMPSGDELLTMVVLDAISNFLPGVLGKLNGTMDNSYALGLLEYLHYLRPAEFCGLIWQEVLLSGDHGRNARWQREQTLLRAWQRRHDLLEKATLTHDDQAFPEQLGRIQENIFHGIINLMGGVRAIIAFLGSAILCRMNPTFLF